MTRDLTKLVLCSVFQPKKRLEPSPKTENMLTTAVWIDLEFEWENNIDLDRMSYRNRRYISSNFKELSQFKTQI